MDAGQPRIAIRRHKPAQRVSARDFMRVAVTVLAILQAVPVAALEWKGPQEAMPSLLFGCSFDGRTRAGEADEEVIIAALYPTWTLGSLSLGRWGFELNVETILGSRVNGTKGLLVGVGPGIRVRHLVFSRWLPYLDLEIGLTYNDMDLEGMGTRFNFSEQVGGGLECRVGNRLSLRGEYRYLHLSNAGISDPNGGLSVRSVLAGFSYSF